MKKISMKKNLLLLLIASLLAVPAMAGDHGEHGKHGHHGEAKVELKIMQDGDLIEVSADDLEVGESRQFLSDSGKEVVLTRLEEGFSLTVDGEEIDLGHGGMMKGGEGEMVKKIIKKMECKHEGECKDHHVMRHEIHGEDHHGGGEHMMFITKGEDDGGEHEMIIRKLHRKSALDHLREEGVLDKLSTSDREMVIESLQKLEEGEMKPHVFTGDEKVWIDDAGTVHEIEVDVEIEEEH